MKAQPKKRKNQPKSGFSQKTPETSHVKRQLLLYSISVAVFAWFTFWIASDIFVWRKSLLEGNVANYIGASASIAFIWAEVKLLKTKQAKRTPISPTQPEQPQPQKPTQPQKTPQKPQEKQTPQPKPQQNPTRQETPPTPPKQTRTKKTKCIHLKNPDQISNECLTCTKLIQCHTNKKQTPTSPS